MSDGCAQTYSFAGVRHIFLALSQSVSNLLAKGLLRTDAHVFGPTVDAQIRYKLACDENSRSSGGMRAAAAAGTFAPSAPLLPLPRSSADGAVLRALGAAAGGTCNELNDCSDSMGVAWSAVGVADSVEKRVRARWSDCSEPWC